ncbi:hypothetical protein M434DRAFT_53703, partial [Hypoxylon sp. CO27-5]
MPTYLCHGFRWHRRSIRYFVVVQNVEEAASEWIVGRQSPVALLDQFYELFDFLPPWQLSETHDDIPEVPSPEPPELDESVPFNDWSVVKFLEEFDPTDLSVVSGPWAYVADYVVRIDTSVSVAEEISRYEARMKTESYKPMSGPSDEEGRKINTFGNKKAGWLEQLRDQLQRTESIRWYVVVCGDEER